MEALLNYDSSGSDDEETKLGSFQTAAIVEKELEKSSKNVVKIHDKKSQFLAEKSCDLRKGGVTIVNQGAVVSSGSTETQKQRCFAKTSVNSSVNTINVNKNVLLNDAKVANKNKIETSNNLQRFSSNNGNSGLYFTTSNRCNYVCKEKNEIKEATSGAGPVRNPEVRALSSRGGRTKPYVSKREREKLKEKVESEIAETQLIGRTNNLDNIEILQNENVESGNRNNKPPRKVWIQFQGHSQCINHVKWNPKKQNLLASASMDQTVAIWDTNRNGACLSRLTYHEGAVKDVKWSACGSLVLSCGYDKYARLVDLETGKQIKSFQHQGYVTCVQFHPTDPNIFLSGTSRHGIFSWDVRDNKIISSYQASFGQVQDVAFLPDGQQFISAAEVLRRNATDKGIMVWDFKTTAVMSNQIYQEAFTCTCLRVHPSGLYFVAQSNGNYMAIFSTKRPYKLNKYKRYEGHQVAAYTIGCDFSPDGTLAISGSADGKMYLYDSHTSRNISSLSAHPSVCVDVSYHPFLPSTVATCTLDGQIVIWV